MLVSFNLFKLKISVSLYQYLTVYKVWLLLTEIEYLLYTPTNPSDPSSP